LTKRSIVRLLRANYDRANLGKLSSLGHIRGSKQLKRHLQAQYQRYCKVYLAQKTSGVWRSVKIR